MASTSYNFYKKKKRQIEINLHQNIIIENLCYLLELNIFQFYEMFPLNIRSKIDLSEWDLNFYDKKAI